MPHAYQVLWHLDVDTVETNGVSVQSRDAQQANLSIIPSAPLGLGLALVMGQEFPEWQGWKAIKDHQQGQYAPIPTACYQLRATGPVRLVTLLYPTRAAELCPVRAVGATADVHDTTLRLRMADGEELVLDEAEFVK